jgi:hypothetical protein
VRRRTGGSWTVVAVAVTVVIMVSARIFAPSDPSVSQVFSRTILGVTLTVVAWMLLGALSRDGVNIGPAFLTCLAMGAGLQLHAKRQAKVRMKKPVR